MMFVFNIASAILPGYSCWHYNVGKSYQHYASTAEIMSLSVIEVFGLLDSKVVKIYYVVV